MTVVKKVEKIKNVDKAEKAKTTKTRKKKTTPKTEAQRMQSGTVGEILKATREQKNVKLEDVSAAINVRVVQLRAIEAGNIDALPGMTYALGFVKSYAAYLKLDSAGIIQKFKAEHGNPQAANQHMHFPEPIADGPQPDWVIIGAAAFCAVIALVLWAVFSDGDQDGTQIADIIPPAPVVETVTGITPEISAPPPSSLAGRNLLKSTAAPVVKAVVDVLPAPVEKEVVSASTFEVSASTTATTSAQAPVVKAPSVAVVKKTTVAKRVIKVTAAKSRVVLEAHKASWIDVRDSNGKTVYKKVLRQGEKYSVPEGSGFTLITTNAGGLNVIVDGEKVQALGKKGEILRGIRLNAEELKKVKIRTRR